MASGSDESPNDAGTSLMNLIDAICGGSSELGAEEAENVLKDWSE